MEIKKSTQELVFIDAAVDNHESLVRGARSGMQTVTIQPHENGIEAITKTLSATSNVQYVHIISHGESGKLFLGSTSLSLGNLKASFRHLRQWTKVLMEGSELLLYGCEVAAGDRGAVFVETLSSWLGVNVAASTHRVGHSRLGGSWNLDYRTGAIRANNAIKASVRAAYQGAFISNDLYASDANGNLYVLDISSGEAVDVGDLSFPTFSIARDDETGSIVYIGNGGNNQQVNVFNPVTQTNTPLGTTGEDILFLKLAQAQNGQFFGLSGDNSNLYISDLDINDPASNGAVTNLGPVNGLPAGSGDIAFNPQDENELFVLVTQAPDVYQLYTIDTSNLAQLDATFIGNITTDGTTLLSPGDGSGSLAFGPDGNLYITSNNPTPTLFRVPVVNGEVPTVNNTITAEFVGETVDEVTGQSIEFTDFGTLPIQPDPLPDIAVTKTDDRTIIAPGAETTYTIVVTNNSGNIAQNIRIEDAIPTEVINATWTVTIPPGAGSLVNPANASGTGDIDVLVNSLNAGESLTITVTGQVDPNTSVNTVIENNVTATPFSPDPTPGNNTATDTTTVVGDLFVTKTDGVDEIDSGDQTTYTIEVFNASAEPLTGIQIIDDIPDIILDPTYTVTIPPGAGSLVDPNDVSGSGDIDIQANLNAGESLTITVTGQVDDDAQDGTVIENTVTASTADITATATDTTTVDDDSGVIGDTPDISVTKTDGRRRIEPGEQTTYTIVVTNNSDEPASSIQITDDIPAEILNVNWTVDIPSGAGTLVDPNDASGSGDIDIQANLNAGESLTITVTGEIDPNTPLGTRIRNVVTAGDPDNDETPEDNTATDRTRVESNDCALGQDLTGTGAQDQIVGTLNSETISGLAGADLLMGMACPDNVFGGRGNDTLFGNQARDILRGNQGNDLAIGGSGRDRLNGGFGNDDLKGRTQNDVLRGRNGNDALDGGLGRDRLKGDDGDDKALGGVGNDRLFGGAGDDALRGGTGNDFIQAGSNDDIVFGGAGADVMNGSFGADEINGKRGDDRARGRRGNDTLKGGAGNDVARGGQNDDVVRGGGGSDTLFGNQGADKVVAGAGNDIARGGLGADRVNGRDGDDRIFLGRGNDQGRGNRGNDVILGKVGDDQISGGAGNDTVDGGLGADKVGGGRGRDLVRGAQGNDRVNGRGGNDEVRGGLGNDILRGGSGVDTLYGGRGNDVLRGGGGNDRLVGDLGNDTLIGGAGADLFVYRQIDERTDVINDFGTGSDRIDVSAIFDDPTFTGGNPLNNLRVRRVSGGSSVVQIDANGNQQGRDWQDLVILAGVRPPAVPDSVFLV